MATDGISTVFEDFNEPRDEPPLSPAADPSLAAAELAEIRDTAWTEGYLTGRRECGRHQGDPPLTAKLLASLHQLAAETSDAVDAAALQVADLLTGTVIAATSETWAAQLQHRVRAVAERIRSALVVEPEFVLREHDGGERLFADISDLSRVLEAGDIAEDVTVRWHRGEATISRTALIEDLREAMGPLSADPTSEQGARSKT